MARIRWYGPTLVLLLTALGVLVAGPAVAQRLAYEHQAATISLVRQDLQTSDLLVTLNEDLTKIAEVVEPSVVSIEARSRQRVSRRSGPSPEELRRFFGPFGDSPFGDRMPLPRGEQDDEPEDRGSERFDVPRVIGSGSGWVYDTQGHIITNNHVIERAEDIVVRFANGDEREAEVVGVDPKTDIAVLKVDPDGLHAAAVNTDSVRKGAIVFAFGSPFRFDFTMSMGIVSATGRQLGILNRAQGYENFIQTDAAINPGNSGGPLTNVRGEVVGMNTAIASRTGAFNGLGFAIPSRMLVNVVKQLIESGRVSRGYLGVYIRDLDRDLAKTFGYEGDGGVLVEGEPIAGGPAASAGIRSGDIIVGIEGSTPDDAEGLRRMIAATPPGTDVEVRIFRDGETITKTITIGELPDRVASASPSRPDAGDSGDAGRHLSDLGITSATTMTRELSRRLDVSFYEGVLIQRVRPGSVASAQGLQPGMVITEVQGEAVDGLESLASELAKHDLTEVGIRLSVRIDDRLRYVFLKLPER